MTDYEWLDKMNLCHRCRKARTAPHRKYCFDCLDKIREENKTRYNPKKAKEYQARRRELYAEKKQAGICVRCTKPATHGLYCYEHSIAAKRHNMQIAENRKIMRHERGLIPEYREKHGLCIRCGKKSNTKYCSECMRNMRAALDKGREKSPYREMEKARYARYARRDARYEKMGDS